MFRKHKPSLYLVGTRKSVDKKGNIIEIATVLPKKAFGQKCKVEECTYERASGSSRCLVHSTKFKLPEHLQTPDVNLSPVPMDQIVSAGTTPRINKDDNASI